jgi:transcriptional regulator with XRE-family HTH domain
VEAGQRLSEARQRRNLTLTDISRATKIPVSVLDAIERNDVNRLPQSFYTRAFVRTYATELGVDPHDLLDDTDGHETAHLQSSSTIVDEPASSRPLLFVALAAVCIVYFGYSLRPSPSDVGPESAAEVVFPGVPPSDQSRGDIALPVVEIVVAPPVLKKVRIEAAVSVTPAPNPVDAAHVITEDGAATSAPLVEPLSAPADDAIPPSEPVRSQPAVEQF